ncbi:MAG: hypothetical protein CMB56_001070 [Methanobacteriota archaeon]|nr:MAG: hypothetical protein CMB56_001070 [Euryarchaeota archaeon]|tara:strand:+ start:1953 stop:2837 length:885 start_codon:yes stop_codon:yes gene_type:complete
MGFFAAIGRGWKLSKLSFGVIKADPELLVYVLIMGIMSIVTLSAMNAPFILQMEWAVTMGTDATTGEEIVSGLTSAGMGWYFGFYMLLSIIVVFWNSAIIANSHMRLSGGDPTFVYGVKKAFSRIHVIVIWGMISGTVGLILKLIRNTNAREQKNPAFQIILTILTIIFEVAWWIMTFFMIPLIVIEGRSIRESMKEGKEMMHRTFGTNIASGLGIQVIGLFFGFLAVLLGIFIGMSLGATIGIIVGGLGVALTIMWVTAAETVSVSALYVFAKTGEMPQIYQNNGMNSFQFNV